MSLSMSYRGSRPNPPWTCGWDRPVLRLPAAPNRPPVGPPTAVTFYRSSLRAVPALVSSVSQAQRAPMPHQPKKQLYVGKTETVMGGKLTCENCRRDDLVDPKRARGGTARPDNEAQVVT